MTIDEFTNLLKEQTIRDQRVNDVKEYFKTRRLGEGKIAADLMRRNGYVIDKR